MQINPNMPQGLTGNPEADAMRYAQANGISLEEAKNQLRSQFGDPQPQGAQGPSLFMPQSQLLQMQAANMPQGSSLFNFNVAQSVQPQPPAPQTPEQMLGLQYGIPPEVVAQGDEAIRKFAQDNSISLPPKDGNTASSTSTEIQTENAASTSKTSNTAANTVISPTANTVSTSETQNDEDAAENGKMSRKEAKAWVKAYRESHNCSKKEAKAAFEKEFGYEYPKNKTFSLGNITVGVIAAGILAASAKAIGRG